MIRHKIVAEIVDGKVVKTRLPKQEAETLFRKIRAAGGIADIHTDMSGQYLTDLFMLGEVSIQHLGTATISKGSSVIEIYPIRDDSVLLLEAIRKVKYEGWTLVRF